MPRDNEAGELSRRCCIAHFLLHRFPSSDMVCSPQQPVMLFMKGNPDAPRCGFSQKTVNLLREQDVEFGWFDILEDEAVRQGALQVLSRLQCRWRCYLSNAASCCCLALAA